MYQWYVDCLIERVLSLEETSERNEILPCIHLLYLFSRARCHLFTEAHLMTLQPYLKESSTGGSEQKVLQYVVMIFQETLPSLKHVNPSLLVQVEKELLTILSKSPQLILNVAIPCLCQVVERLTKSYQFLTRVLRSCFDKLTREAQGMTAGKPLPPLKTLMRMLILLGLVCRHFNFDAHRAKQPDRFPELHAFPAGTVTTRVFTTVAKFTQVSLPQPLQLVAVQSLGNLFQGYPSLLLRDESRTLMDRIFASTDRDLKLQLLKVFLELLSQEQLKLDRDKDGTPAANAKLHATVDLKVLIGNAQELGDAGVCSAIMQCYVDA
ncbi:Sister chromatid cohesion protein 2, partial [Dimargaris verticillata]